MPPVPEGGAHSQALLQPKRGRTGAASLGESRPAGRTPDEGRGLRRLQEGRPHHRPMLEGAPGANSRGYTEKKGKRDVSASQEEAAVPDLP